MPIHGLTRSDLTYGIVQVSLDVRSMDDALRMAAIAADAGADWLEIGTPLVKAEGAHAIRRLRAEYPEHALIADGKTMDGGYGETTMFADAGADAVVVMGRAHDETITRACAAGRQLGVLVMGDDMGAADRVAESRRLEGLGIGMIVHHIGFDHRDGQPEAGLSPMTDLAAIVAATTVPVQAVGGLSIDEAASCPTIGAGVVVFGAPLVSAATPEAEMRAVLKDAVARVHETPVAKAA